MAKIFRSETFLPFDLEFTYGAALALIMAHFLFPDIVPDEAFLGETHSILDEMTSKGNRLAQVRQQELQRLDALFKELKRREDINANRTAAEDTASAAMSATCVLEDTLTNSERLPNSQNSLKNFAGSSEAPMFSQEVFDQGDVAFNGNTLLGLSSDDMFLLADQIGLEDDYLYNGTENQWAWEGA